MKRSTCKEVKQAIQAYILDNITLQDYNIDETALSNREKLLQVFEIFKSEKQWEIDRYGLPAACKSWLQGIPSAIATAIYYYDQRAIIATWLDETQEESAKYDDSVIADTYYWLVTREFLSMVKKEMKNA